MLPVIAANVEACRIWALELQIINSENLQKMNNEQMKVAECPAQIAGKPNVVRRDYKLKIKSQNMSIKHDREPIKHTCPDIDKYIKWINSDIEQDRYLKNMDEKDLFWPRRIRHQVFILMHCLPIQCLSKSVRCE